MDGQGSSILDYRGRLDKTLTSPDLSNEEIVHSLVRSQILQTLDSDQEYTDRAVERRSKEVFKFLNELRSAASNDSHNGWKVKQDTEELRVMYREGPEGTPFHTLLAEGYVDGPIDVCLCISCDSDLYMKWWPQIAIPTFRVTASHCVQKVIVGEQISIVRMKLSWPMSGREAVVHYFVFEYFQDDLVVVLVESISDSETIDRSTHGFTRDGIPDALDDVRMDLYGGFALKKVTADRSFFRTIANLDIKLDFVPPALINFVARQLIGSGFKLYKKEVASAKGSVKFQEALRDPLYTRVREALYEQDTDIILEQQTSEALQDTRGDDEHGAGSEAMYAADARDTRGYKQDTDIILEKQTSEALQDTRGDNEHGAGSEAMDAADARDTRGDKHDTDIILEQQTSEALQDIRGDNEHGAGSEAMDAADARDTRGDKQDTYIILEQQTSEALQDTRGDNEHGAGSEAMYAADARDTRGDKQDTDIILEQQTSEALQDTRGDNEHGTGSEAMDAADAHDTETTLNEIEEFEEKPSDRSTEGLDEGGQKLHNDITDEITEESRIEKMEASRTEVRRSHETMEHFTCDVKTKVSISPEVQRALETLEKAISLLREYNCSPGSNGDLLSLENDAMKESITPEESHEVKNTNQAHVEPPKPAVQTARISSDNHGSRRSSSSVRETNQSKIAPASPDEDGKSPSHSKHTDPPSSLNQRNASIVSEITTRNNLMDGEAKNDPKRKKKKLRFCCLAFNASKLE